MEQRRGLKPLQSLLEKRKNIILKGADRITAHGFTQVPNYVLENAKLSAGAKLVYAMLLKYAWQNDFCFPGQERLAGDMGAGKRSVVRFIKELEKQDFIKIKRQGQGRPNLYTLNLIVNNNRQKK